MKKRILILLGINLAILLFVLWFIAPLLLIQPKRAHEPKIKVTKHTTLEKFDIKCKNDIIISAYSLRHKTKKPRAVIILLHGIHANKAKLIQRAKKVVNRNYQAVVIDSRAHGLSGGQFNSFGLREKEDLSQVIDYIRNRYKVEKIGIWGQSLGAAIALQTAEIEDLSFVISESSFSSLPKVVDLYADRILGFASMDWLNNFLIYRAESMADFNFEDVNLIRSAQNIEEPTLLIHGTEDKKIPATESELIYKNLGAENKKLILVPGGKHSGMLGKNKNYVDSIFAFIRSSTI